MCVLLLTQGKASQRFNLDLATRFSRPPCRLSSPFTVSLFPTPAAISVNLFPRSRRLSSSLSLSSITLMNGEGACRVTTGIVSANASLSFWQIGPINLIYHHFPSSFNKFLWAFPPLMTGHGDESPRGKPRHYSAARATHHMLLQAHYCFSINVHTRGHITCQGPLSWR